MGTKSTRTVTVRRTLEIDVEIECTVTPGEPDHYDRSLGGPGGWSPGCGPEVEIVTISTEKGALLNILDELDQRTIGRIEDDAIEAAAEDEQDERDDYDDRRVDAYRDRMRGID